MTPGAEGRSLTELVLSIVFLWNTMSPVVMRMCAQGDWPWLRFAMTENPLEGLQIRENDMIAADNAFL